MLAGNESSTSERRVRTAAVTCALVGSLPVFLTGGLAVQIGRDITFGPARLGMASGAYFAAAAMGSALMGRVAERLGPGVSMRAAIAASGTILALLVVVPNYPALIAMLAAAGFSNSLAQVSANLLVARAVAPQRQGWALALKQAGVPAATLLGGLAVPVVGVTVGWRWAFAAAATLAVVTVMVVPIGAVSAAGKRGRHARAGDAPLGPMIMLAASGGLAAGANNATATFLVSAGVDVGMGEATAGLVLTMGAALGIAMRLLAGVRADIRGSRHLPVVALLLTGGSVGYALLSVGVLPLHLVGTALAFGSGWAWPGLFNLAVVRLNPSAPGAATGITQTGVYVGALAGPVLFGFIVDHVGYPWAWGLVTCWVLLAAVGVTVSRRVLMRSRPASIPTG